MTEPATDEPFSDPVPRPTTATTMPPKGADRGPKSATSPTIATLGRRLEAGDTGALEEFWRMIGLNGAPLIEPDPASSSDHIVTFVARESDPEAEVLLFANRLTDPEYYDRSVLRPLAGSDLRYLSVRAGSGWRCQYQVGRAPGELTPQAERMVERSLAAGSQVPRELLVRWWGAYAGAAADPFHLREGRWAEIVTDASWVELPAAAPAPALTRRVDAAARLQRHEFHSALLGDTRAVWLYTPPPAETDRDPGLLVLTDGEDWVRNGLISALLDGPIASGALPPLTVVLVEAGAPDRRVRDLACSPAFIDALDTEVLPRFVDPLLRVPAERTIIAGASLGGLTAAYAGLRRPRRFGVVYSQSGSFWWPTVSDLREEPEWLTRRFAVAPLQPLRFRLEAGLHEHVLVGSTRHFRDVLHAKGYEVSYQEVDGGHDFLWWAAHLPSGLEVLTHDW